MHSNVLSTGCSGVTLSGGKKETLEPSQNEIFGSIFTKFSRWTRTYVPGIHWSGVGHWIHNNEIFNAPHAAVLGGDDLLFENNRIEHVGYTGTRVRIALKTLLRTTLPR